MKKTWRSLNSEAGRAALTCVVVLALTAAWQADVLPSRAQRLAEAAGNSGLNDLGLDQETQNYYQVLMDDAETNADQMIKGGVAASIIAKFFSDQKVSQRWQTSNLVATGAGEILSHGFNRRRLKPNVDVIFSGVPFKTNRWGMRDDECELKKPPRTFRICLAGSSNEMGNGVERPHIFADVLEKMLNERLSSKSGGPGWERYELLNMSLGGTGMLDRMNSIQERMVDFEPDLILVSVSAYDLGWLVYEALATKVSEGRALSYSLRGQQRPYQFLIDIVARAKAAPHEGVDSLKRKFRRYREPLLDGCFAEMRKFSNEISVPIVPYMLRLNISQTHPNLAWAAQSAARHGLTALMIVDKYEGQKPEEIYLDPMRDHHPTPKGHALIAEELYDKMMAEPRVRAMLLASPAGAVDTQETEE